MCFKGVFSNSTNNFENHFLKKSCEGSAVAFEKKVIPTNFIEFANISEVRTKVCKSVLINLSDLQEQTTFP